nr:hypothetical protein [Ralstonia sp. UBA689]
MLPALLATPLGLAVADESLPPQPASITADNAAAASDAPRVLGNPAKSLVDNLDFFMAIMAFFRVMNAIT